MIQRIGVLRRIPPTGPTADRLRAACSLGVEQQRWLEVIPFALRLFESGTEQEHLRAAANYLVQALSASPSLPSADQRAMRMLLLPFALKGKKEAVSGLNVFELTTRYQILLFLSPSNHLRERLCMEQELFRRIEKPSEKVILANALLNTAALLKAQQSESINLASLKLVADYFAQHCTSANIPDNLVFEDTLSWLVFLGSQQSLGWHSLVVSAVATRGASATASQEAFAQLCSLRALSDTAPNTAVEQLDLIAIQVKAETYDRFLPMANAMFIEIHARAISACFSQGRMQLADFQAYAPATAGLKLTRADCSVLMNEVERIREQLLQRIVNHINEKSAYLCLPARIELGSSQFIAYVLVFLPEGKNLKLYLEFDTGNNPEIAFCIRFPVIERGDQLRISSTPTLEKIKPGESSQVPVWVDYFCLRILAACGESLSQHPEGTGPTLMPAIEALVTRANEIAFGRSNQAIFAALQTRFSAQPQARDAALMMDRNSRTHLARVIWEEFISSISEGTYTVGEADFLYPFVETVAFQPAGEAKFPLTLRFNLRAEGRSLAAVLHSPDRLEIPGVATLADDSVVPFLLNLVLEAGVSLFAPAQRRNGRDGKSEVAGAYIGENGVTGDHSAAIRRLEGLYARAVLARIQYNGLMGETWFYRQNDLFYPLDAQDPAAKQAALARHRPENLFILLEPSGRICRLPVGRRRKGPELVFDSYESDPARRTQQGILGDQRLLPTYYGLYIITEFSDGSAVAGRVALRATEDEVLNTTLLNQVQAELNRGDYQAIDWIVRHISDKDLRNKVRQRITSKTIAITGQCCDVFAVNTTFRIPPFIALAALLEQGQKL